MVSRGHNNDQPPSLPQCMSGAHKGWVDSGRPNNPEVQNPSLHRESNWRLLDSKAKLYRSATRQGRDQREMLVSV